MKFTDYKLVQRFGYLIGMTLYKHRRKGTFIFYKRSSLGTNHDSISQSFKSKKLAIEAKENDKLKWRNAW